MGKRCDCVQVRRDNPDKTFEELIKSGLICDVCAKSYYEFCKIIEEDEQKTIKNDSS